VTTLPYHGKKAEISEKTSKIAIVQTKLAGSQKNEGQRSSTETCIHEFNERQVTQAKLVQHTTNGFNGRKDPFSCTSTLSTTEKRVWENGNMQTTNTVPRNWLFDWVDFDSTSEAFGLACFLGRHADSRSALHLWLNPCLLTVRWIGNVEVLHGHESNAGFMMSHAAVVRSW
jgi:hypothetical protein